MNFELKDYHRDISKEELIEDLCNVSQRFNNEYISRSVYEKNGKYSSTPYISNFGSWLNALHVAGLKTERTTNEYKKIKDSDILNDVKSVTIKLLQNTITTSDYKINGKYSIGIVLERFGSWEKTLEAAGLEGTGFIKRIGTIELLTEIEALWIKLGRQPTTTDIKNGNSKYSLNSYTRRFGSWRKALEEFIKHINIEDSPTQIMSKEETKEKDVKPLKVIVRRTPRDINDRLRFKVLKRDNFKCVCCGKSPAIDSNVQLHVDHIIPWSKGGETVMENLQTLCSKCNLGKSNVL